MTWNRIHYIAINTDGEEEEGVIDVISEPYSWDTFCAVRADVRTYGRWVDCSKAIEIMRTGEGDGSLAVNRDPRDADKSGEVGFPITVVKGE